MFGSFRSGASNRLCSEYVHVKAQNLEKILAFKTFGLFTCVYTYIYIYMCIRCWKAWVCTDHF